ncbi:hypothetical protein [Archangium primigenium]|uniref:hypothetical protein n=1 Tax=[Archangium] primigenium TaxID=2792470 RepID=UPI00195EC405|nr:hypothetical protein [Archangium primigenium]MBM7116092.1 hypothetical protein [Archangium primigenium]
MKTSLVDLRSNLRAPSTDARIEFLQYEQPPLESGVYTVTVSQTVKVEGQERSVPARTLTFAVQGERFGPLAPEDIAAVFPPDGSVGEHSNVLPHISLRRSTLPWERLPGTEDENLSWLALLLFRDSDFAGDPDRSRKFKAQSVTLGQLSSSPGAGRFPTVQLEPGQSAEDMVTVIDVRRDLLQSLLPTSAELALLAHARQRKTAGGEPEGDAQSTVLCNRLPEPGADSIVHMVSLEGRYKDGAFDFQGAGDSDFIRLVSLTSWRFHSVDPAQGFTALLKRLNREPGSLRAPAAGTSAAQAWLAQGHVPVPHALREGDKTVSFYRGPLIPGSPPDAPTLPARSADELLRYDPTTGLLDVSYASAWELGRLLTLANTRVALELYNWKRKVAQEGNAQSQRAVRGLPAKRRRLAMRAMDAGMPEAAAAWFQDLSVLRGLPFNYVIPDEKLLPAESLRFFWLDPVWVECLQDGALSVGRVTETDFLGDQGLRSRVATRSGGRVVTGFVMRSSVVSGWPDLLVEAYNERVENADFLPTDQQTLTPVRIEKLSKDVLIGLFEGELKTLDVHQKPEAMHFGLDVQEGSDSANYSKNLRDLDSGAGSEELIIDAVPWREADKGLVDVVGLAEAMRGKLGQQSFTAAPFALQMIEGVQKVRFVSKG